MFTIIIVIVIYNVFVGIYPSLSFGIGYVCVCVWLIDVEITHLLSHLFVIVTPK